MEPVHFQIPCGGGDWYRSAHITPRLWDCRHSVALANSHSLEGGSCGEVLATPKVNTYTYWIVVVL